MVTRALPGSRCVSTAFFFSCVAAGLQVQAQTTWDLDPLFSDVTHGGRIVIETNKNSVLKASARDPRWVTARGFVATMPDASPEEIKTLSEENEVEKRAFSVVRKDELDASSLKEALQDPYGEAIVCPWLHEKIENANTVEDSIHALHYAHCSSAEFPPFPRASKLKLSDQVRFRRAQRMFGNVRFTNASIELDAMKIGDAHEMACDVWFLRGRVLYRLRKRRSESEPAYKKAVEVCRSDDPAQSTLKKKSLYAWGKRRFDLKDYKNARKPFETLVTDYADTSHLDDGLMYLARIYRKLGETKLEKEVVERAVKDAPTGDVVFEIAWEFAEPLYKAKKFKAFIERVEALNLPENDEQYFSQGRLQYFMANSHLALKKPTAAYELWQEAWSKYPFSFYGYLSSLRLLEKKQTPTPLVRDDDVPDFLEDDAWRQSALAWAIRNQQYQFALWLTENTTATDDQERWRMAHAVDAAGNFPRSHNIVRRKIPGRPWISPKKGTMRRLQIAWPSPFIKEIRDAIAAESAQRKKVNLNAAFPISIMREESSFIEDIESYAGALGLMQLMPRTALGHDNDIEGDATPERLKTADVNIRVGVDHLFWLSSRLDGHPALMAAAYNAGLGALGRWLKKQPNDDIAMFIEDIPSLQTRDYTKRVVGSYAAYQWLWGAETLDKKLARPPKP